MPRALPILYSTFSIFRPRLHTHSPKRSPSALHPFVRLQIKGSIFTERSSVSIKKLLAPYEVTKRSTIGPDRIQAGEATVQFKRIQLCVPSTLSPWCTPTIHGTHVSYNTASFETLPHSVFNFGCIMSFPNRAAGLYRISLQQQISDNSRHNIEDGFLFTKQLKELSETIKSDENKLFSDSSEAIFVEGTKSSRSLLKILPGHAPCLSPCIVSMANVALMRSSILIHGDTGCGKTFTSLLMAAISRLMRGDRCVYLSCRKLRDSHTIRMKTMLTELEATFHEAYKLAPCVVILDDLDAIAPNFHSGDQADNSSLSHDVNPSEVDQSKLVSDILRYLMRTKKQGVSVFATTSSMQSLSQFLSSKGIFNHHVAVPALSDNEREILYRSFLDRFTTSGEARWVRDSNFVRHTSGFRPRDIELLAFRTMHYQSNHNQSQKITLNEATTKALEMYVPLSRLSSNNEDVVGPAYKFCDIGGLCRPKAELISTIVRPSLYCRIYAQAKVRLPRGVLLFGFPGSGKSMCVPALARECGYPLITCRGPELLDKYIGASEAKIRELFSRAAAAAPSILFLDELDALAPRRGSDHTGVTDRIVNQLLTFLDGVEDVADSAAGRTVYVIGATSRPDKVDPALLRPGRLEKHIYFGLSDDLIEVKDLILKISEGYALKKKALAAISSGKIVEEMSSSNQLFRFFSAADFTSMFNAAQLMAVRKALDAGCTDGAAGISYQNLVDAMMSTRPSLSQPDYERLSEIYMSYRQGTSTKHPSSLEEKQHTQPILTALK